MSPRSAQVVGERIAGPEFEGLARQLRAATRARLVLIRAGRGASAQCVGRDSDGPSVLDREAERLADSVGTAPLVIPRWRMLPLRCDSGPLGAIVLAPGDDDGWSAQDERAFQDFAHIASALLCARSTSNAIAEIQTRDARRLRESEQRLAYALDATDDGLWDWHVPSGAVYFSPAWCRMLGYEADEVAPSVDSWAAGVHPDDWPQINAALGPHLRGETSQYQCEHRVRHKAGHWIWILDRGKVVERDEHGEAIRMVGTHTDVTKRREVEAALQASEERYALAARASKHAIWSWELSNGIVRWTEGITTIFGYAEREVHGSSAWWIARVHPDDQQHVEHGLATAQRSPDTHEWQATYRYRRADGSYALVEDRGYIVRDPSGAPVRMVGAMEDVTVQHELTQRLTHAQRMEAIGQLAGGIAHDFNNLLTVMTASLELTREALPIGTPVASEIEAIAAASERAKSLVRQLLTFSRKQPTEARDVAVGKTLQQLAPMLRRLIGEEIVLETVIESSSAATPDDASGGGPREDMVSIDPGQLEQVVLNLAVNARDAMLTPAHGHPGKGGALQLASSAIVLETGDPRLGEDLRPGRYVRLRVCDTGHGMDAATLGRIFEPFFTTKPPGTGTGLGMSTVFGIVRGAGGAVRIDTGVGLGTTVDIYLPRVSCPAVRPAETAPTSARGSTMRVLLVEDDADVRRTSKRLLERLGHVVTEASDGVDALRHVDNEGVPFGAVVTDLRMPRMNGRDLVDQLRALDPTLPVVFVTGYAEAELPPTLGRRDTLLHKPFTGLELATALEQVTVEPRRWGDAASDPWGSAAGDVAEPMRPIPAGLSGRA